MTTNELTQAILKSLNATPQCFAWRNNNLATRGRRHNVRKGAPDILAVWQGMPLGIEVKNKATNDKASEAQKDFAEKFTQAGGFFLFVTGWDEWHAVWNSGNRLVNLEQTPF